MIPNLTAFWCNAYIIFRQIDFPFVTSKNSKYLFNIFLAVDSIPLLNPINIWMIITFVVIMMKDIAEVVSYNHSVWSDWPVDFQVILMKFALVNKTFETRSYYATIMTMIPLSGFHCNHFFCEVVWLRIKLAMSSSKNFSIFENFCRLNYSYRYNLL